MKGWQFKKLNDLCEFRNGLWKGKNPPYQTVGVIRNTNFTKDGFLDDSNIAYLEVEIKQYSTRKLYAGDLILEKSGGGPKQPVGRVILFDEEKGEFSFSNFTSIIRVRDRSTLLPKYLHKVLHFFYLSGVTESMQKNSTNIRNLQLKEYKEIEVPVPPIAEQKRIVAIVDEVFEGIDSAIANAEKNLANARELFESCLSSLDAEKRSLGDLVNIRTGKLNANAATEGGQYPFFTCSRDIYQIDHYAFDCEAILLAGNNAVGDFNVKHYRGKFNAYQRTYVITVNQNSEILYRYLYFQLLKSLKEFKSKSVGAGTRFLKLDMIKDLQISLPSLDEQEKIIAVLDELREAVQELEAIYQRKLAALNELKQSILQKAFSGELTAEAGDRAVEGAKAVVAA